MKKTINVLGVLALTVLANISYAKDLDLDFEVNVLGDQAFSLVIDDANQSLEVFFLDNKGEILYQGEVERGATFEQTFVLIDLKSGNYQVKIADAMKVQLVPVAYKNQKVAINMEDVKTIFYPVITERNKDLTVGSIIESDAVLDIRIEDQWGMLVFSESLTGNQYIGRRFDFSKVKGVYTVTVNNGGLISSKQVAIY